jgi:predicted NAD/FAD-dependent oxidoreductase
MNVAIVGAGAAGVGVAYALRDEPADVTVFEKSRGVCGRAATRRRAGCRYDHGANYVRADDPRVMSLLTETLDTDGLVDIAEPIHVFEADGTIEPGRDAADHKWTWEAGITQLAKRLFARTDADVRRETRVGGLERVAPTGDDAADGAWRVTEDDGTDLGRYDAVVLTPPAPQTVALLEATDWTDPCRERLHDAAAGVEFRTTVTAVLHYPVRIERPWYALLNVDREHDVGWLAREECKTGHVPDGESLLIAQMAPGWSRRRYDDPPEAACADAAGLVADLLDDGRLTDPDWTDWQGWRYAQPDSPFDADDARRRAETAGLYLAGDWLAGEGRVHLALRAGLDVGERIG